MADRSHGVDRPVHSAFLQGLLPCPHQKCLDNFSFYSKYGLSHNFRSMHGRTNEANDLKEALKLMESKHEEETLKCLQDISQSRARVVYFHDKALS